MSFQIEYTFNGAECIDIVEASSKYDAKKQLKRRRQALGLRSENDVEIKKITPLEG
jgi:hypothetical protein